MAKMPSYRCKKARGKSYAIVTLTDAVTKRKKDYWMGLYDSPESHEKYHRLLADWQAAGRRLPCSASKSINAAVLWKNK